MLLEKTIILNSQLSKEMWREAIRTATCLVNRSPMASLKTTVVEKWNMKQPNLSRFHIFRSKVHFE